MKIAVDHQAMAVAGYVEPWSAAAGARRQVSLSVDRPVDRVSVRRLDRDGMPAVDWVVTALPDRPAHRQWAQGSWAYLAEDELAAVETPNGMSLELLLTRNAGARVLLDGERFALVVVGTLLMHRQDGEDVVIGRLPQEQWLALELDWREGTLSVRALDPFRPFSLSARVPPGRPASLTFCSDRAQSLPTLNCRLGRLRVGAQHWRFPTLRSAGPIRSMDAPVHLALYGNPSFCVTSARWDGTSLDPRLAPDHYDAVHFHDTDMDGLDWPPSFGIDVPETAESGVYAVEVVAGEAVERLVFFVTASRPAAPLLFVVPTATYLAYADEYLPPHLYEWIGTDRGHVFARDNQLRSLYDYHRDGSGVSLASTRKPKATLRDDYRYPLCGDPHLLPVDLHFLRFCARNRIAIDLATDFELHAEGAALLARYRGVATGSHPEYLSSAMERAYRDYIAQGGRLAYLGGNGFAAAVAFEGDVMELRRGPTQAGRTWDGPLAEMSLALTNEPGGYFRDRGRGEYKLVGVGIALMGFSKALPFTRTPQSHESRFDWLFAGVDAETFGESGIVLGGAAGYEVDSTNPHLGSPPDIAILATAAGFPPDYVDDPGKWFEGGETERTERRRAEMTWWEHPSGGAVFCASSVAWLGALPEDGENAVGTITANLLRHFSNFPEPAKDKASNTRNSP